MATSFSLLQNFNADTPAPPYGCSNIIFQDDGGSPVSSISAFDPLMVGDSGTGGYSGNVPAPAAGDAATGKFLKADGTWTAPQPTAAQQGWTSGNNANGYWEKTPTGHIRQWGKISSDINNTETAVTFPIPFTNLDSISLAVSTYSITDRITYVVNDGTQSLTGFSVDNNGSAGFAYWQADGY